MASNNNFTVKAGEALQAAFQLATGRGNPEVTPAHLLDALLGQPDGLAPRLLEKVGALVTRVRDDLADVLVAHRHRHLDRALGPVVPVPDVHVGAADGGLLHR
jgi:ATP-dependent Clp protease ATP-binding subunit ClpA